MSPPSGTKRRHWRHKPIEKVYVFILEENKRDAIGADPHPQTHAEAAQAHSRNLAKMMFIASTPLAWSRDQVLKFYTFEHLAKTIAKIFEQPI